MKKLLFASLLSLFTLAVSAQSIITNSPYCSNSGILVTGNVAAHHASGKVYWTIAPSDVFGNPTASPYYTSTPTNSGSFSSYTFSSSTAGLLGNSYALVTLYIEINSNPNYYTSVTTVIYVTGIPQPVFSSPTVCGTGGGTVCAVLGTGESVVSWVHNVFTSPIYTSGPCLTLPANYNDYVLLNTTNTCGLTGTAGATIHSYDNNPDFNVNINVINGTYFNAVASPVATLMPGMTETWYIEEATQYPGHPPVYFGLSNTGAYNPSCWNSPTVNFNGYDGANNSNYNGGNLNNCFSGPYFLNGHYYRIIRTVSVAGCSTQTMSKVISSTGIQCSNCREAQEADNTISPSGSFDVFPNPNNGTFQVQLNESAENAQVELFNTLGERVDAFTMTGTDYSYTPTKTLAPGIYLLRVSSNGSVNSKRIVIE
jgi:hypothetical protein